MKLSITEPTVKQRGNRLKPLETSLFRPTWTRHKEQTRAYSAMLAWYLI